MAVNSRFDDEDDDVLDNWEAAGESDDDELSKMNEPTRKRVPVHQRIAERENKERLELEKKAIESAIEDEKTKKERLRQAQFESDLNHATNLLGEADLHPRSRASNTSSVSTPVGPTKLSDLAIFKAKTKADFDTLRKTLAPLLNELSETSSTMHANFVIELCRDVCKPLSPDQIRKVTSTLTALSNEKVREERANRGKKKKPIVKASSTKVDEVRDTTNYEEFDDDDDFM